MTASIFFGDIFVVNVFGISSGVLSWIVGGGRE